jgi:hypothetical protein
VGPAVVGLQKRGDNPRNAVAGARIANCRSACNICWSLYSAVFTLILKMQTLIRQLLEMVLHCLFACTTERLCLSSRIDIVPLVVLEDF